MDQELSASAPAAPTWRFEPSPASEAVWANDLLIDNIYQSLIKILPGRHDLINWMILSKDRFASIANSFWYSAYPEELFGTLDKGCTSERFNMYSSAVRELIYRETEFDKHPSASSIVQDWQGRLPNLDLICLRRTLSTGERRVIVTKRFTCNGRQVRCEIPIGSSQSVETDGETGSAPVLTAVIAEARKIVPVQKDALGDIVRMFDPGTFGGFATGLSLAGLRELRILPDEGQQWYSIEMSRLDHILGLCPELGIIACRLAESDALDPTEEALDTLFSKGSRLEVVHIETSGYLVPWLSALLRFRTVTLACEPSLRVGDLDLLYGHMDAKLPAVPRLRHFRFSAWRKSNIEGNEFPEPHLHGPYPVARIIQKLLPPGCQVSCTRDMLPRGSMNLDPNRWTWWERFEDIIEAIMKDVGPRRPVIRPMTKAELASQLDKRGEGPRD